MLTHTTVGDDGLVIARINAAAKGTSWCGIDLVPGTILVYAAGAEHVGVDRPGLEFTFVATQVDRMHELAERSQLSLRLPDRGTVSVLKTPSRTRAVDRAFGALSTAMTTSNSVRSPIGDDALCAMVGALVDPDRSLVVGIGRRLDSREIVRACLDYAESVQRIPSNGELRLAAHVSERRLRQAFTDEFDMPPTNVFRAWALDLAHRQLAASQSDGTTVENAKAQLVMNGQHLKKTAFYVRLNNKTHEFTDADEKQKYIAQRWGR